MTFPKNTKVLTAETAAKVCKQLARDQKQQLNDYRNLVHTMMYMTKAADALAGANSWWDEFFSHMETPTLGKAISALEAVQLQLAEGGETEHVILNVLNTITMLEDMQKCQSSESESPSQ